MVPLTGLAGYFTRQGAFIGEYNRVASVYGQDLDDGFQAIWVQFASSDQAAVQNLPNAVIAFRNTGQSYQAVLQGDGQQASILQVTDDTVVVPSTLKQSILVLSTQMFVATQSIQRAVTSTATVPWVGNISDADLTYGLNNNLGAPLDMVFSEEINVICTAAGTAFQETLQFTGPPTVPSNNPAWPGGSGTSTSIQIFDPAVTGIVTDGGFEVWSGTGNNTPTNWPIVNGAPGVTVFRGIGGIRGSFYAEVLSDGAQATQLTQNVVLAINTMYAVPVQAIINTLSATGTLVVSLTDSSGVVIIDNQGIPLTQTFGLNAGTGVDVTWKNFKAYFSTPRQLPLTTQIRIGYGVAPPAARELGIDLAGIFAPTQLYPGGPFATPVAGANRTAVGDNWVTIVANNLTSQSFARGMDRMYGMRQMGVFFPSSLTPTISDALVTN